MGGDEQTLTDQVPDFGGELDSGLDDEGFLWMCGHTGLLLHHEGTEDKTNFHPLFYHFIL